MAKHSPELEHELAARVIEMVDALAQPAGQYALRARMCLEDFAHEVLAIAARFDDAETPPRGTRAPQHTMELKLTDLIWDEEPTR